MKHTAKWRVRHVPSFVESRLAGAETAQFTAAPARVAGTPIARAFLAKVITTGTLAVGLAAQPAQANPPASSAVAPVADVARVTAVAPSQSGTCTLPAGLVTTFTVEGTKRTYLIRIPPSAGPSTPLVMSIHGATGTAPGQQAVTGFTPDLTATQAQVGQGHVDGGVARTVPVENTESALVRTMASLGQSQGFIAVFPQARAEMNYVWDANPNSSDILFIARLTEHLHAHGCSTPQRTSINGFSMGAMMTSRLICARPDLYSGAAMVGGALNPLPGCTLPADRGILVIHGQHDAVVPYNGSLPPVLAGLAGPDSLSSVNRQGIAINWARVKDCPSPGWTTKGPNRLTDLTCPRSTTLAVIGESMGHTWDHPGLNTSNLVWAALRPARACTQHPPSPPNPTLAAALERRIASDVAFRIEFSRGLTELIQCNPHVRDSLTSAIRAAVAAHPDGPIAQQIAFAIREKARLGLG